MLRSRLKILIALFALQGALLPLAQGQLKSFLISAKGDTINAVDKSGLKQGKWVNHIDEIRGEPGYEEEGIYKNDKKEGPWRLYNLNSDLIGVENYANGGKDGLQQYFTYLGDLIREELWKGYNPNSPYDTIPIYGSGNNEIIEYKVVKAEQYSVKHGEWRYFEPGTGRLVKTETYDHNRLVVPGGPKPPVAAADDKQKKKVEKTPEMLEWEKKNKGKKKVVRDGATGL